ncbi:right-handed parallel beta-helix repeat-containing protein [Candidatus Woesearchaeota archaeon]|nr:right-handed parallel beta-helix repeat-containing protein [Candidatus Woesearchaeota archaeon]
MNTIGRFSLFVLFSLLATSFTSAMECGSVPTDGCTVTVRTTFTPGTYFLPNGITIKKSGITLDCNQATLLGGGNKTGIKVKGGFQKKVERSTIKNCIVKNYGDGIHLADGDGKTQYNNITDNYLINNTNDIFINTWVRRNTIWKNIIHSRIYYQYSNENNYCVGGVGNDYIGDATGTTCEGFYPYNGMGILSDINLLPGTYYLPSGMTVWTDGITIECNNSTLIGKGASDGIKLLGYSGWGANYNTVRNCNIENYSNGIHAYSYSSGASFNNITKNSFRNNNRDVYISSGNNYNRVWDNTITSSVYYTSISTHIYCVDGVGNNYIGNATGPTCGGMYLYDGLVLFSSPVVLPGVYKIPKGIYFFDDNLTLDCSNAALIGNGTGNGITVDSDQANRVKITNCDIRNYSNGIFMGDYPWYNTITKNTFSDNSNDIFLKQRWNTGQLNVGFNKIWDNLITSRIYYLFSDDNQYCINGTGNAYIGNATGPTCDGFYPYDRLKVNSNIKLLNRTFKLPNGIELFRNRTLDCNNATLLGSGRGTGVIFNYSSYAKLTNCHIGNYSDGTLLHTESTLGPLTRNTITGNSFFNNTNDILVKYASNNTIVNNTILSRIYYPYYLSNIFCSEGYGNRYVDNATGPTCEGIFLYDGLIIETDVAAIPRTYLLPNGVRVWGKGAHLNCQNAEIVGVGNWTGILVQGYYPRPSKNGVSNCIVSNFSRGIVVQGGRLNPNNDNNTLITNTVFNNSFGIYIETDTINTTIAGNLVINNTYGAYIDGPSKNSRVRKNTITGNSFGIYTQEQRILFEENNIFGNSIYNLYNKQELSLNATHNWWNSLNPAEIDSAIYDDEESGGISGEVNFSSWLLDAVGTCSNGYRDEGEGDIDCGGSCRVCNKEQTCNADSDCTTKFCNGNGICAAPSCYDNEKNGAEEGIDCGWACLNPCSTCYGVKVNGDEEKKIDVVFVGSGFPDADTLLRVVEEFIDYNGTQSGLMSEEPFASQRNRFNFWAVTVLENFSAEEKQYETQAKSLASASCPQMDQMVLLSVQPRFIPHAYARPLSSRGGKYAFLMAGCEYLGTCNFPLDIANPAKNQGPDDCKGAGTKPQCSLYGGGKAELRRTLLHEFGHSFGGLNDEYEFGASTIYLPFGVPNCDDSGCGKWAGINDTACIQTCGYTNWYRAYSNTIMRNQYDARATYGEVNRRELERDINESANDFFALQSLGDEPYNLSFLLTANYSAGNVSLSNVALVSGKPSTASEQNGTYSIRIYSFENKTLDEIKFSFSLESIYAPPSEWFDANGSQNLAGNESGIVESNITMEIISLPYFPGVQMIGLYGSNGSLIGEENVSSYHDLDRDKIPSLADNCPLVKNNGQDDSNNNGIGDACQVPLAKGWSFISFPSLPANATVLGGLEGMPVNWARPPFSFSHGSWIKLSNSSPINGTFGFFVHALKDGNFSFAGMPYSLPQNISLEKGWNMVSYPSGRSGNINEFIENLSISRVYSLQGNQWLSYRKGRVDNQNTLKSFTPGFGYWVYADEETQWIVE